jgi:hypothetical protein
VHGFGDQVAPDAGCAEIRWISGSRRVTKTHREVYNPFAVPPGLLLVF